MNIAVFSGKGGVGKSTLSAAIALHCKATLIDCDPQLTASDWGDRRQGTPPLVIATALGRVPRMAQEHGLIVVDTPGSLVGNASAALRAVDLVLVVTGDRQPELDALISTIDMARESGKPVAVVLNRVHPFANAEPLREFIREIDECVRVSPVVLRERAAHYRAWALGQTAEEYEPGGAAANEIHDLAYWLETGYKA
jgi:chromosome partitioning protein